MSKSQAQKPLKRRESKYRTQFKFEKPSLTKQSCLVDTDILSIMRQFQITGQLPATNKTPMYLDTTKIDFQEGHYTLAEAKSIFETLPTEEKERLGTPAALVDEIISRASETPIFDETDQEVGADPYNPDDPSNRLAEASESRSHSENQEQAEE